VTAPQTIPRSLHGPSISATVRPSGEIRGHCACAAGRWSGRRFARAAQDVGALAHQAAQGFQDAL